MGKVVFVQRMWQEQLGVISLGGFLKEHGHEAEVIIETSGPELPRAVAAARPTLIAFSTTTGDHTWVAERADAIKKVLPEVPVVAGGPHPTYFPEFINSPGIDYICRGEGEESLLDLVEAIEGGGSPTVIPNIWASIGGKIYQNDVRPLLDPLDELPFADRTLYFKYPFFKRDRVSHVMFSRGCPFSCSYCFNAAYRELYRKKGKYVRLRSVEHSIAELQEIRRGYDVRLFYFVDDIFGLNHGWADEFLGRYAHEIRIPFICNSHVQYITDQLAKGLAGANCFSVQFAIESANDEIRKQVLHRHETNQEIIAAGERLHRHGIRFLTYNMLGCPGETTEQALETIELNTRLSTDFPRFSLLQPYPQTPIYRLAVEAGVIQETDIDHFSASYFFDSVVKQANIKELINLQRLFLPAIRLPRMRRVIRLLIKLPPNFVFDLIYLIFIGLQYARCTRRGLVRTALYGLRNLRFWRS